MLETGSWRANQAMISAGVISGGIAASARACNAALSGQAAASFITASISANFAPLP